MGSFRFKKKGKKMEGYKIKITSEIADMLQVSISERDNFIKSANEKLTSLNRTVDTQISTILSMSGKDIHADRGDTGVRKIDGGFYLVVDPPKPPQETAIMSQPHRRRGANGATAPEPERAVQSDEQV